MSYEELTRIQNGINILKNTYNNYDDDYIYYEILDNISDTCSIKKSLLELDRINCISGDKPIFDSEKIQELLLITQDDKQLLGKYFKDEHANIIPYLTNQGFIKAQIKNSGLDKIQNCKTTGVDAKKLGGTSKTKKMRSRRSQKRSKKRSKKK